MPNRIKYNRETKEKVYRMYHEGRKVHEVYSKGKYSLRDITRATGVPANMICMIAKGER